MSTEAVTHDWHSNQKVLDKGFVRVVHSGFSDETVVRAAKVSFASDDLEGVDFARFIGFLMKNKHGTPFEHCSATFQVKAPLFVLREWQRHRIASYNEMSGRYTEIVDEFYVPAREDIRSQVGKPGSYSFTPFADDQEADQVHYLMETMARHCFERYHELLEMGVAKEVARMILPLNTYSMMYFTVNPRALMNFLELRLAEDAQWEIRQYAQALSFAFHSLMPVTAMAFATNGYIAP